MKRQSIEPTYDHQATGDRYNVDTRVGDRHVSHVPCRDPFVHHRVVVGWRDLLRGLLRGRLEVTVVVGGDSSVVEDVLELDADYLGTNCTRRDQFNAKLHQALERVGRG